MSKIHIEGLNKTYTSKHGPVTALKDVRLSIKQNEFVTLVGPSGCGKSTLLKLMGALIRPSRGTLLFDGAPLLRPTRDVGIVFQEAVLLDRSNLRPLCAGPYTVAFPSATWNERKQGKAVCASRATRKSVSGTHGIKEFWTRRWARPERMVAVMLL